MILTPRFSPCGISNAYETATHVKRVKRDTNVALSMDLVVKSEAFRSGKLGTSAHAHPPIVARGCNSHAICGFIGYPALFICPCRPYKTLPENTDQRAKPRWRRQSRASEERALGTMLKKSGKTLIYSTRPLVTVFLRAPQQMGVNGSEGGQIL